MHSTAVSETWLSLIMNAKNFHKQKKDEITLSPMTKAPIPSENQKVKRQHKDANKNFDYTTIADQIGMVSWSN